MRRRWSIKTLFAAGFAAVVLVPLTIIVGGFILLVLVNLPELQRIGDQVHQTSRELASFVENNWMVLQNEPQRFSAELEPLLARGGAAAEIRDSYGRVLFTSPGIVDGEWKGRPNAGLELTPTQRIEMLRGPDGQLLGAMAVWVSPPEGARTLRRMAATTVLSGVGALILIAFGLVWYISRLTLTPLARLGRATESIGAGDLNFDLPESGVRELRQLTDGFAAMRDRLRASLARQTALEQERRELIAAFSHDLRTPLTSIRGYVEGLRDRIARDPSRIDRYIDIILQKTAVLEQLIGDLFDYSRMELQEHHLKREKVTLGPFLEALVDAFKPQARARGVDLQIEGQGDGQHSVILDPHAMARVIDNLLDNALRHTATGGQVTLSWQVEGDHTHICISDTGEGIPAEDLPRLFQPLFRGDRSRSRTTGGAGLGLAIAKRIVDSHGGTIRVESRAGEGTRFVITL